MKDTRKTWTPQRLAEWEQTRARGKRRFVWTHGVLQWGGFMFVFSTMVYQHQVFGDIFSTQGNLPFRLILGVLVWTFVGYLYGRSKWQRNEREYAEQTKSRNKGTFVS
ncbi:MAG: hypothetical protein LOY00_07525 [Methylocaldum sp.]|nr:hypothetical protein [Methylocaldum sp.]